LNFPIALFEQTSYTRPIVLKDEASTLPGREGPYSISEKDLQGAKPAEPDPNNPAWGLGGAFVVLFLSICLIVVVPILIVVPYVLSQGFTLGTPEQARALAEFATTDKTSIILQIAALLPIHLLTLFMVWALVTRFGKRPFWSAIGWSWGNLSPGQGLAACIGLGIALFIVGSLIAKVLGGDTPTPLEQIINSSLAARYLISFFAVATAPFVEEFIYRGVLYAPLQKLIGVKGAVVIVLALFTIIHVPQYLPNVGVISAVFLLSVALTVIRAVSGRLLPCIIIHFVFNGIQALLLVLEPYLQRFIPTPDPVTPPAFILLPLIGALT
jgi:membrane protease YdiL (CAAX protease family)